MRRTIKTLAALALLTAPAAFAADAMTASPDGMMKKDEPAMMKKEDAMMKKDDGMMKPNAPAMMAKRAQLSAYVTSRLDALADKIARGTKKEANLRWLRTAQAAAAHGSRAEAVYAYLIEKLEAKGMMKDDGSMMKKPDAMMKKDDAMMKKEEPAMMKKDDAMMKAETGAMMAR